MKLLDLARATAASARHHGADEVAVTATRSTEVSLIRRAGKLEQAQQATSLGLSLALLVGDRFSTHSTSDLRPAALEAFLGRAIAATRVLEPEPERRQAPVERCGRGSTEAELDLDDPDWAAISVDTRRSWAEELEAAVDALPDRGRILSATASYGDSMEESARVMSNGFEAERRGTGFGAYVEVTLEDEGGRRPEAFAGYSVAHRGDMPPAAQIAREAWERAAQRLGSRSIASGAYPMLLENRAAGRILGLLGGPLSGAELHQQRSCLAGKLGERIASPLLSLVDDPTLRRGLGSRPYDADGLVAKPMPVIEEGVLRNYYVSMYYSRKLGVEPTTGGRSNWVLRPGTRTPEEILRSLPRCILVNGFLGGNSNNLSGDFSFGVQGLYYEHGEVKAHLSEMNVSGNILEIFHQLAEAGSDVWTWGSTRSPSLLFDGVQFSGS